MFTQFVIHSEENMLIIQHKDLIGKEISSKKLLFAPMLVNGLKHINYNNSFGSITVVYDEKIISKTDVIQKSRLFFGPYLRNSFKEFQ